MQMLIINVRIKPLVLCLFLLASSYVQAQSDTIKTGKSNDPMAIDPGKSKDLMTVDPGKPSDNMVALSDTGFISKNIRDCKMEISLAKTGLANGNISVKNTARQIISGNTILLNDLNKLAAGKDGTEKFPEEPQLKTKPGSNFNTKWTTLMLTMLDEKISEFEKYLPVAQNKELKHAIGMALPRIRSEKKMLLKMPGAKSTANTMVQ